MSEIPLSVYQVIAVLADSEALARLNEPAPTHDREEK